VYAQFKTKETGNPKMRGEHNRKPSDRINVRLALLIIRQIASHNSVRLPELCELAKDNGFTSVSRSTINRLLTDIEAHLGVKVRFSREIGGGGYYIEDWGYLNPGKIIKENE